VTGVQTCALPIYLDSLDAASQDALARSGAEVRIYPAQKDWSDLELALGEALAQKPDVVVILGALGERLDHELTNIHLLERGLEARIPVTLVEGSERVRMVDGSCTLDDASVGDRVSLVPISEAVRLTAIGLAYPLHGDVLRRASSRGVSNSVAALPVQIDVESGRLLVLHNRRAEAQ
jgi:thiamine pyrophosphokinase